MWTEFLYSVFISCFLLYSTGYFLLRCTGAQRLFSLAAAPLMSALCYILLSILLPRLDVFCSWKTVFLPCLLICVFFALLRFRLKGKPKSSPLKTKASWKAFSIYIAVGIAIGIYVYLICLESPCAFSQENDNEAHLNVIRAFLDSGNWSPFGINSQLSSFDKATAPTAYSASSFYPSLFYTLVALTSEMSSTPLAMSTNAMIFTLSSLVLPTGFFLLISQIEKSSVPVTTCGAFCCLAPGAFPWEFLVFGPLYPNLTGMALLPAFSALVMIAVHQFSRRNSCIGLFVLSACSLPALVLAHPNALFTAIVFLAPYSTSKILKRIPKATGIEQRQRRRNRIIALLFVLLVFAFWFGMMEIPLVKRVFGVTNTSTESLSQAFINTGAFAFSGRPAQLLVAALVLFGIIYLLLKKNHRWLVVSYVIMAMILVINTSLSGDFYKVFTGYWYSVPVRISANLAFFSVPIASIALATAARTLTNIAKDCQERRAALAITISTCLVFSLINYYPNFKINGIGTVKTTYSSLRKDIRDRYKDGSRSIYGIDKYKFVERARALIPEHARIINNPNDGSVFSYAVNGVNTYYRRVFMNLIQASDSHASAAIRKRLDKVSTDAEVRDALKDIDAHYLLLLNYGDSLKEHFHWSTYEKSHEYMTGIESVTDTTPGFEILLKQDDMRLYRITAVDKN